MSNNKTIIYYTSNKENELFENKVRDQILKVSEGLPIISVSQKSIEFGHNICVGERGHSYLNAFRQILIGCQTAETDYVFMTESDCLYPEGYFDFEPTNLESIYSYDNVWVLWEKYNKFFKKEETHGSMIYGRKNLIFILTELLKDYPEWGLGRYPILLPHERVWFTGKPVINIKTNTAPNKGLWFKRIESKTKELPYWGTIEDVKRNYEI
jgi:hypothetical protein